MTDNSTGWDGSKLSARLTRLARRPWHEKVRSIRSFFKVRWNSLFPMIPLPVRLPEGSWWLAWNDAQGDSIFLGEQESGEREFVSKFLEPAMTVLDLGAHQGYYTVLASRRVGGEGKVIAFEPSPRELKRLKQNLELNFCRNVEIEPVALGESEGPAEFFLVDGPETGCNSLRRPEVDQRLKVLQVRVERLDHVLHRLGISKVDFIKMDVEGGELSALRGATELLSRRPRPVILSEIQDLRTKPWGYPASEIVSFLSHRGYSWFSVETGGRMHAMPPPSGEVCGTFVAVPEERLNKVRFAVNGRERHE